MNGFMERAPFRGMVQTLIHADITSFISAHWLYLLYLLLGSPPCQLRHRSLSSPSLTLCLSSPPLLTICIFHFFPSPEAPNENLPADPL